MVQRCSYCGKDISYMVGGRAVIGTCQSAESAARCPLIQDVDCSCSKKNGPFHTLNQHSLQEREVLLSK
jgi:hypothetical protein